MWIRGTSFILLFYYVTSQISEKDILKKTTQKCENCKNIIKTVDYFKNITNKEQILEFIAKDCSDEYSDALIPMICHYLTTKKDINIVLALKTMKISPEEICNFYLNNVCDGEVIERLQIKMPNSKKPENRSTVGPKNIKQNLTILHISDSFHDLFCQKNCNLSKSIDNSVIFESAFQHMGSIHKKVDFVFWTGDIPPIDVWDQSVDSNQQYFDATLEILNKYFGQAQIYPAVGDYQSYLINSILASKNMMSWNKKLSQLFKFLLLQWSHLFPADGEKNWRKNVKSILQGGYYTALAKPGLRVISLNGNDCNKYNALLIKNKTEPSNQLAWLVQGLEAAEKNREKVLILNSIPPSSSNCDESWRLNYYKIVNRYEATIIAHFFGHVPYGEIEIFYDIKDHKRPVSVGYAGQSLISSNDNIPAYTLYYIDGYYRNTSWEIIDAETYSIDYSKHNDNQKPIWYKEYEDKKDYKIPSLLPTDWHNLIHQVP